MVAGPCERGVDVGHAQLDQLGHDARRGRDLLAADVGHDERAVLAGPKLGAMVFADADALLESERRLEPRHRGPDVG